MKDSTTGVKVSEEPVPFVYDANSGAVLTPSPADAPTAATDAHATLIRDLSAMVEELHDTVQIMATRRRLIDYTARTLIDADRETRSYQESHQELAELTRRALRLIAVADRVLG